LSSQAQVIYLNENNNAIFAIFSINLLTKIEREKYISNLFFIEWSMKPINIIAFFPFIKKIDITVYHFIYIILTKKKKRTRKK
jgi:hypothetical protein